MKKTSFLVFVAFIFLNFSASSKTWLVGASRTYIKPSQVSTLVGNGDTVDIDAGIYASDVARWSANNLLLRGVGGYAYLQSNGADYGGKAIWVIAGANTTVEWIEFSGCIVPDDNGAGIRQEGANLIVRHCYFHDNQEGILAGSVANSKIVIEFTEFYNNGAGDGFSHNLYINHIDTLVFRFNYSHLADVGHELKSRASVNYILYNRISNESTGTASRNIDLPNGGQAYIIGNVIEKGPQAENRNAIEFGLEGLTNPSPHGFYLINNTIVSNRSSVTFIDLASGTSLYKAYNNIFAGPGILLNGSATTIDTSHNWFTTNVASVGFTNPSSYDYHLSTGSPAINIGANPGNANGGFNLIPLFEYKEGMDSIVRNPSGIIDLGSYEYASPLLLPNNALTSISLYQFNKELYILSDLQSTNCGIYNVSGELMISKILYGARNTIDLHRLAAGTYLVKLGSEKTIKTGKIIIQ